MTYYEHLLATRNQLIIASNRLQGSHRRALFVCTAGVLRSATAAHIFSAEPYNWNTRTAGIDISVALNPVNEALMEWADAIYLMEDEHRTLLFNVFPTVIHYYEDKIREVLNVPDKYNYRDPTLIQLLKTAVHRVENYTTYPEE